MRHVNHAMVSGVTLNKLKNLYDSEFSSLPLTVERHDRERDLRIDHGLIRFSESFSTSKLANEQCAKSVRNISSTKMFHDDLLNFLELKIHCV